MGYRFAKVFGPTDSVAQIVAEGRKKTQIGSDYIIPPGPNGENMRLHIHKLIIGKGNVVNAKECAGILEVIIKGVDGTFEYAYGNGSGGATNSAQNGPAEPIDCRIPISSGNTLQIYVNDAEIAKDVTVSAFFWDGHERVDSYAAGGGAVDCTADTELSFAAIKILKAGKIKQIRFAGSVIADAEAGSAKLTVEPPGGGLPQEFAVGNGPGGATLGGAQWADVIDVDIGIQGQNIPVNTQIVCKITAAEALKSPTVSIAVA
jgi:hypothetical protein